MDRTEQDLSHDVRLVGDLGRLHTVMRLPVIAGDSLEIDSRILIQLAQLRRPLAVDVKVDLFAFFCPYRQTYGQTWIDYIEAGAKEAVTFPTLSFGSEVYPSLLCNAVNMPKHVWSDYARIWNFFFRDPSVAEISEDTLITDLDTRQRGLQVFNLKGWGTAQAKNAALVGADYEATVTAGKINLYDLQTYTATMRDVVMKTWIGKRYVDVMESISGVAVEKFVDNQPELVWEHTEWMSGYEVNGTAGPDFGASIGRGVASVNLRIPRRLFTEHGTFWVLAVLRLPPIYANQVQFFDRNFNRPQNHLVPQSNIDVPPYLLTMNDVFLNGSGSEILGGIPAYDWYRCHPHYVHPGFIDYDAGWQFLPEPSTQIATIQVGNYDSMFQSLRLRHFITSARNNVRAWRVLPDGGRSIFAET